MKSAIKIGFDISQTGSNKAGCGFFADSLINALAENDQRNNYILYPNFGDSYWHPAGRKKAGHISQPNVRRVDIGNTRHAATSFWSNFPEDGEKRLGNPDIVHSNNFSCPTALKNTKLIFTLYDLGFLEYPEFTTELNRWICFNGVLKASGYADFIVAISSYSREKFLEIFPYYPNERIRAVHLGSRFANLKQNDNVRRAVNGLTADKFWLAVGTLEPRKNLRRLLRAFKQYIQSAQEQYPLVLAGGKGWLEDDLKDYIDSLGIRNKVVLTGYVSDDELAWLYGCCFAFLYPSVYEGFGLPVLEAMSMGAAVITSKTTSIPEVAGDAALLIDPLSEQNLIDAFYLIANNHDFRNSMKMRSLERAKHFSWERCASEVIEIYDHVMALPKLSVESL